MTDPGITHVSNEADIPDDKPIAVEIAETRELRRFFESVRQIDRTLRRIADCIERAIPERAANDRVFRR